MTKAFYIFSFLIISNLSSFSQSSINDYKYIIVPTQFDFLKEKDQYQINSLTKFLFNKYGYIAFMQDEDFPEDLRNNRCLALTADVVKSNALLKTKMQIELKDCNGNLIQSSDIGETREKEYAKAYNLAVRDAFKTFRYANYSYQPNENILAKGTPTTPITPVVAAENNEEIARLKREIETLKEEQVEVVKPEVNVQMTEQKKVITSLVELVEDYNSKGGLLYAQPIENGFQIVDTSPKKVMILQNSGVKDVFTVEGKKAIVYKKGDVWMYSESGDILKGEIINIKF